MREFLRMSPESFTANFRQRLINFSELELGFSYQLLPCLAVVTEFFSIPVCHKNLCSDMSGFTAYHVVSQGEYLFYSDRSELFCCDSPADSEMSKCSISETMSRLATPFRPSYKSKIVYLLKFNVILPRLFTA